MKAFLQRVFNRGRGRPAPTERAVETFPYPVVIAGRRRTLTPANAAASGLPQAILRGEAADIHALVARSCASGESAAELVAVPEGDGTLLFEIVVMPTRGGTAVVLAKDVTLDTNLRSALVESRQRYKDLVEISTDFAWEIDSDGGFSFVSGRGALGYSAEQLIGRRPEEFLVDRPGVDCLLPFRAERPVEDAEAWMRRSDGGSACLRISSSPMLDAEGRRAGARGVWHDVTKEREREEALDRANHRERLLTYIVRTIRDVVDPADMLRIAAEAISRALANCGCQIYRRQADGVVEAALFGEVGDALPVLAALATGEVFDGTIERARVFGCISRYRREMNGAIVVWRGLDGARWSDDERFLVENVADQIGIANEQVANHERILALSRTDALTGLFNRRAFFEEMSRRFARLAQENKPAALIYIDLDNFKAVNDRHGHKFGDDALLAVREILSHHTRPTDLVARLGGDEFALWLEGADEQTAVRRCRDIIAAAASLAEYSGSVGQPLTMSLGVAVHDPAIRESLADLLQRADEAMYTVKREGKSDFRLAAPARSP